MEIFKKYEEYKSVNQAVAWLVLFALSAGLIGWAMLLNVLIPPSKRTWDFGATSDTPAQSKYSTIEPAAGAQTHQQLQLPEEYVIKQSSANDR